MIVYYGKSSTRVLYLSWNHLSLCKMNCLHSHILVDAYMDYPVLTRQSVFWLRVLDWFYKIEIQVMWLRLRRANVWLHEYVFILIVVKWGPSSPFLVILLYFCACIEIFICQKRKLMQGLCWSLSLVTTMLIYLYICIAFCMDVQTSKILKHPFPFL